MNLLLVISAVLLSATLSVAKPERSENVVPKGIKIQRIDDEHIFNGTFLTDLDHFRPLDSRQIEFLYHVNAEHYVEGGPLYINIKDAGDNSNRWIVQGLLVDIASETGGALFTVDHRYSGHNRFSDLAVEDLEHLTVEQSLQDIATLVEDLRNANYPRSVILFGSGFGGTLAVWARKKFPHLVNGAYSSSGIFNLQLATFTVHDGLESIFTATDDAECRDLAHAAFDEIERLIVEEAGAQLENLFNLCGPIDTTDAQDVSAFYEAIYNLLINYFNELDANAVTDVCRSLRVITGNPLASFARWLNFVVPRDTCFDPSYATLILENSDHAAEDGYRQWLYLQCSQFAIFPIGDGATWIPSIPLSYHFQKCQDLFGENFSEVALDHSMENLVTSFGSLGQHVTSAIYTNGGIDPWKYNGILTSNVWDTFTFHLDHQGKSVDLRSISGRDTEQTDSIKREIREIILRWSLNPEN